MTSIIEFFREQNVFVTGGTGFMGKVLLEKLLRSCSDMGNIYVLIRPKKGKEPSERIKDVTNLPLFDVLKRECPENLKKLIPVFGDCMELGLGLSSSDRKMLEEKVSIVFHLAASVRFDDTLKYAAVMNTRGTRELMLLVRNMKNLKVLVHVSTTYCNCDKQVVEEIIHPPHADWREIINIVENIDENTVNILTPKILGNLPNTYTFTKSLAEHVVKELGDNLPIVICRPSIVVSSLDDPFPGWVDNFNGPIGLLAAGGTGVLRVSLGNPNSILDCMPVDVAIKIMCLAAWEKGRSGDILEPSVYNVASGNIKRMTMEKLLKIGFEIMDESPLNPVWKPYANATDSKMLYYCRMILVHLIPAILVDSLLKFSGRKPMLLKLHRRIFIASMALFHFTTNTWVFKHDNMFCLRDKMVPSDKKDFSLDRIEYIDEKQFYREAANGARLYLLKQSEDLTQARKCYIRLWWLDAVLRVVRIVFILWVLYRSALLQNAFISIHKAAMDITAIDSPAVPM